MEQVKLALSNKTRMDVVFMVSLIVCPPKETHTFAFHKALLAKKT